MVKNLFMYIFIYILLVGCGTDNIMGYNQNLVYDSTDNVCNDNSEVTIYSLLDRDSNDYYHMDYIVGYNQTFATIYGELGNIETYKKMSWQANKKYCWNQQGTDGLVCTSIINPTSYSEDGNFQTTLGVQETFIGDTIKIYGMYNSCGTTKVDSIGVIIDG